MANELLISWIKVIVALPVVLLLAYISLKLSKGYTNTLKRNKKMKVIETVPLYEKSALSIVQIGSKYFVLGVSNQNIQKISELSPEEILEMQLDQELDQKAVNMSKWMEKIKDLRNAR